MSFVFRPYQLLSAVLAGWVNREQQQRLEYQQAEIQVFKEVVGKKRIVLNDVQRRRLAVHGKILGRKALGEIATLFTPVVKCQRVDQKSLFSRGVENDLVVSPKSLEESTRRLERTMRLCDFPDRALSIDRIEQTFFLLVD